RRRRGRLGEPVALEDGHADAAEEVPEPWAEWGTPRHRVAHLTAQRGPQLAEDQPVEERVLRPQPEARPALVLCLAERDRRVGRGTEDVALAVGLGPLHRR